MQCRLRVPNKQAKAVSFGNSGTILLAEERSDSPRIRPCRRSRGWNGSPPNASRNRPFAGSGTRCRAQSRPACCRRQLPQAEQFRKVAACQRAMAKEPANVPLTSNLLRRPPLLAAPVVEAATTAAAAASAATVVEGEFERSSRMMRATADVLGGAGRLAGKVSGNPYLGVRNFLRR
jgi:hypothetical protein